MLSICYHLTSRLFSSKVILLCVVMLLIIFACIIRRMTNICVICWQGKEKRKDIYNEPFVKSVFVFERN